MSHYTFNVEIDVSHYHAINEKFKQHGYFKHTGILLEKNHYYTDN